MEMLIVVAIIAILIAIAIPTFASSLNKARVATDEANIRSGYASVMATVLTDDKIDVEGNGENKDVVYKLNKDGSVTENTAKNEYKMQGTPSDDVEIAGQTVTKWAKGNTVTYTYNYKTNKVTITVGAGA